MSKAAQRQRVNVSLSRRTHAKIEELCRRTGETVAAWIARAACEKVAAKEER